MDKEAKGRTNSIAYVPYQSWQQAYSVISEMGNEIARKVIEENTGEDGLNLLFKTTKAAPFALPYFSTVLSCMKDNERVFAILRFLLPILARKINPEDYTICSILNEGTHDK